MMKVLVIEDEKLIAQSMLTMLYNINPNLELFSTRSIKDSEVFLRLHSDIDCIFADIRLSDGMSFAIFDKINTDAAVIFTTSYDEYAIKAFDYNCIGYLLKPVKEECLRKMLEKFQLYRYRPEQMKDINTIAEYRKRLFLEKGDNTIIAAVDEIVYFFTEQGYTRVYLKDGSVAGLDESLLKIMTGLNPNIFFRVNRQTIVNVDYIAGIHNGIFRDSSIWLKSPFAGTKIRLSSDKKNELTELLNR